MEQKILTKSILSVSEQGHKKSMQDFISRGVVNVVDEEGSTPLMYAAANGREEIIRLLLDEKCIATNNLEYNTDIKYINRHNIYGWTALMQAACYGHLNIVMSLIQRGADVNIENTWGASALVGASQGGFYGVVHKLLNSGAEVNPTEKNGEGVETLSPLMAATQCGHVEIVQELLRRGADVNTQLRGTKWTALMLAALNNQLSAMEILLEHGADKSISDINGQTAADLATALGHHDIVLLLTGKKPKECSDAEFFEIVKSGDVSRVCSVLETQRQLANSRDKDGATPLMLAANRGNIKLCEALLEGGANVDTTDDKYGWTALMLATHQRKYEVVEFLGKRGADVNVRGKSGSTAFDVANMIGDIKMIRLVANISVEQIQRRRNSDAPPPLAIPARSGDRESLRNHLPPSAATVGVEVKSKEKVAKTNEGGATEAVSNRKSIDLTDLKRRLEKAYKTPTPNLSVDDNRDQINDAPAQSRFPMKPTTAPSPRQQATHPSPSFSSSGKSDLSSPFSISESLSRIDKPPTPTQPPRSKSPNLFLKGNSAPKIAPNFRPSSAKGPSMTPSLTSKRNLGTRTGSPSLRAKLKGAPSLPHMHVPKPEREGLRRRADTAPVSPFKGPAKAKKKISLTRQPIGIDIKGALEMDSLGHLYPIFKEQEITMSELMTLNESDLAELGVGSGDIERVRSLITKLRVTSPSLTPVSPSPVFTFLP